ncbi:NADP-dependent oxidoreductase [Microbulbifer sp. ANSA005]|uniref:NADP-dependent oxidoreductase n=1 Tax=Microbulbifer sp. ANSA005 TaxID=3243362 RepID=UPI00404101FB
MQAAIIRSYGSPIEIAQMPKPSPDKNSILVKVQSASINPLDNWAISGALQNVMPVKMPHIVGYDVTGKVVEIGSAVRNFKIGDLIFARPDTNQAGTIAEYTSIKAMDAAIRPCNLSNNECAAFPLVGLTAWQSLIEVGKLQKGQRVLIHAGSGGVGTIAIQIAKYIGAFVATTTSDANFTLVKRLGADTVINYKTEKFEELLEDYDLVLDSLGGEVLERSAKVLNKHGLLVSVSVKAKGADTLIEKMRQRLQLVYSWPSGTTLAELASLLEKEFLKPVIDRVYPIHETQAALDYLNKGRAKGKIVIDVLQGK